MKDIRSTYEKQLETDKCMYENLMMKERTTHKDVLKTLRLTIENTNKKHEQVLVDQKNRLENKINSLKCSNLCFRIIFKVSSAVCS